MTPPLRSRSRSVCRIRRTRCLRAKALVDPPVPLLRVCRRVLPCAAVATSAPAAAAARLQRGQLRQRSRKSPSRASPSPSHRRSHHDRPAPLEAQASAQSRPPVALFPLPPPPRSATGACTAATVPAAMPAALPLPAACGCRWSGSLTWKASCRIWRRCPALHPNRVSHVAACTRVSPMNSRERWAKILALCVLSSIPLTDLPGSARPSTRVPPDPSMCPCASVESRRAAARQVCDAHHETGGDEPVAQRGGQ